MGIQDDGQRGILVNGVRPVDLSSDISVAHGEVDRRLLHVGDRFLGRGWDERRIGLADAVGTDVARAHREDHHVAERNGLAIVRNDPV